MKYVLVILTVSLLSISCQTQTKSDTVDIVNSDLENAIDTVFKNTETFAPGYMISVIKKDQFLFQKGYGLANLEQNIEINKNTCFNIASLSKQITAASIALFDKAIKEFPLNNEYKVFKAMTLYNLENHQEAMYLLLNVVAKTSTDRGIQEYQKAIQYYSDKLEKII